LKFQKTFLLSLLIVSILCFSFGCTSDSQTINESETAKDSVSDSKVLTLYEKIKSDAMASSSSESDLAKDETMTSQTVYRTQTGACYHESWCRHLAKSKIAITLQEAESIGLRACSKCDPPVVE